MKVIVCGGGTGGHIYPALSIAACLQEDGAEILYMGAKHSSEEKLAAQNGFAFSGVDACGLHKRSLRILRDLAVNFRGSIQAKKQIRAFAPELVIGTGGYAEAPIILAAQQLGIKTMLHEQNAFPGLANRRLSRRADAVCLTFAAAQKHFPDVQRMYVTGLPIRKQILTTTKAMAYEYFSIPAAEQNLFTLLITGGSTGAASLNQAAVDSYEALFAAGIRVLHITGGENYAAIKAVAPRHPQLILRPYLDEMQYALALADLACARSGASFLAEAACLGLPTILVPYPYAANNHQHENARVLEEAGAAELIENADFCAATLTQAVLALAKDPARLKNMAAAAKQLAQPDAARRIADVAQHLRQGI